MASFYWKIITANADTEGLKRAHYTRAGSREEAAEWMRGYMDSKLRKIVKINKCSEFEYIHNTRRS